MKTYTLPLYLTCCLILSTCRTNSPDTGTEDHQPVRAEECAQNGMVVTAHPLATEVGLQILKDGGNAFDAAIAVKFALSVVYPRAGNIGGGGFMVYRQENGEMGALNFREKAPAKAHRDMYLDQSGNVIKDASTLGHLAAGVPGTVDGMTQIHARLGSMLWQDLVEPAVQLAEDGFTLTAMEAEKLNQYQVALSVMNSAEMPLLHSSDSWSEGDTITLPELGATLARIRDKGRDGFYSGRTAELLLEEMDQGEGIISQVDLDTYRSEWTETISGKYRGYDVHSMPPPSSGGVAVLQLLKGLEAYNMDSLGHQTVESIHLMTELERRVYADRATHLGDPDFWDVPVDMLLDKSYLELRNSDIQMDKKTDSQDIKEGDVKRIESIETTHFSIIDAAGNAVAITTTLNGNYGSKVMVDGAGFFLNNQMDDFSIKPGHPNMYGLVGAEANAIAPGKRMLSSMSPTIVLKDGETFLILGTPGGSTIITTVFQNIVNVVDHHMTLAESVSSPRIHHQWLPDRILYEEDGLSYEMIQELKSMGHQLESRPSIGRVDAIMIDQGCMIGIGDSRGDDTSMGF